MNKVMVSKETLMNTLTVNREKHKAAYNEACLGYQRAAIEQLDKERQAVDKDRTHRIIITEFPPTNHTADYDKALRMLKLSVEDKVEISSEEFTRYVEDDWDWKQIWAASTRKYLVGTPSPVILNNA